MADIRSGVTLRPSLTKQIMKHGVLQIHMKFRKLFFFIKTDLQHFWMNCFLCKQHRCGEESLKRLLTCFPTPTCFPSDDVWKGDSPDLIFLHLASLVLHISYSFPLSLSSPVSSFLCLFLSLRHFRHYIPLSAFVSPLSLLCGRVTLSSDLQGITPHFVPVHLHALMSLEQHAQPTNLQTCLAGILHDGLLLLLGALVFWRRERAKAGRGLALSWA